MQARGFLLEQLATWQLGPKPRNVGLIQRQDLAVAAVVLDVLENIRLHELMADLLVRFAVLTAHHARCTRQCMHPVTMDMQSTQCQLCVEAVDDGVRSPLFPNRAETW